MAERPATPQIPQTPTRYDFNEISEPGTYVLETTGSLLRIGPQALLAGHSPLITVTDKAGMPCVRIWPDDTLPIEKARHIAANFGIPVNF